MRIGLISDTHGLIRPEALDAMRGCAHILHAGDIGKPEILDALRPIAPLTAVRGNNDRAAWARAIRDTEALELGDVAIYLIHEIGLLDVDPAADGFGVVVSGHSHRPAIETRAGVLYVNPGSAGPRRFTLPVSVGFLEIEAGTLRARIERLPV
ncbi:MAG TPA: metallophosphoesterase family protein [Burkholderiales bacterium]|jgi:putative phosphoesterase|nr:metallophosphoesterase family protein [Burkholderiales bacterium]